MKKQVLSFLSSFILVVTIVVAMFAAPKMVRAARTDGAWLERLGSYLEVAWPEGRNILINGTNKYLNFGSVSGSSGYGFRDNGGSMQFKNSSGAWTTFGTGGGGSGGGTWSTTTSPVSGQLVNYPNNTTDIVVVGDSGTSTANYFIDPNTVSAFFKYASSTALTADVFCFGGDSCRSAWPTDVTFSTTSADYWQTQRNFFSTTSVAYWETTQARWATTSADYWKTQRNFFSTTSADYWKSVTTFTGASTTLLTDNNTWTGLNIFSKATTTNLTVTSSAWLTNLATPAGTILAVDPNGKIIATTTSAGGVTAVTGTYPVQSTGGATPVISLAFGTTTANTWSALQTFGNASTSLLSVSGQSWFTGLATFGNASSSILSATTLCLTGDSCRTTWPTGTGGAWPFTPSSYGGVANQSTTTPLWLNGTKIIASTTLFTYASTSMLSIQDWSVATSTVVCKAPETCQFQVPASSVTADVQIQAAINSLSYGGGTVLIKAGSYTIDTPITIAASGVAILGESQQDTVLTPKTNFNDYVFKVNDSALREFLQFRNFKIDGNRTNQVRGGCIMASSTARSTFDSIQLENCLHHGIKLSGPAAGGFGYNNTISNNYIANNLVGIETVNNDENIIANNTINSSKIYHIYDRQGLNNIHNNVFTTVGGVATTGVAVYIEYTASTLVANNTFDNMAEEAILMQCGGGTNGNHVIQGNVIYHTSSGGYGDAAIRANGPCRNNIIFGNAVPAASASNPYGYLESGTSPIGTILRGNFFTGTSSAMSLGSDTTSTQFFDYSTSTPGNTYTWAQTDATGLFGFNVPTASSYYWSINGTKKLVMDTNGQIGISTTTPGSLLSVQGVANFGTATSTFYSTGGINLTGGGCFAINGTCITGGSGAPWPFVTGTNFGATNATTTLWFTSGLTASSTSQLANANIWGTLRLTATSSSLLATDASGNVIATSSIGTNLLTGALGNVNTTAPLSGGGSLSRGGTLSLTWTGLATTSQPSSSNLLVSNGAAGVYGVATTSLAVSAPITFSGTLGAQIGGSGGSFGCTSASSAATGCLTNTDWSKFDNKVSSSSLSATYPLSYTSGTGVFSLAFGTTTANSWSALQTITNSTTTFATFTNAPWFTSLTASTLLALDVNRQVVSTTTIGWNLLKGPASSIFAFDASGNPVATTSIGVNYITGTLPVSKGGTGTSTNAATGNVLSWTGGTWQGVATSSLGLPTFSDLSSYVPTSRNINTTYPITGGGTLASDKTIAIAFGTTTANTWSALQTFGNASSTILSATTLCLTGDTCRTSWPTGSGGAWPWNLTTNYGVAVNSTTTPTWYQNGLHASSTSHFVYASTTALSATTICLNGSCQSGWGSGSPGGTGTELQFRDGGSFGAVVSAYSAGRLSIGTTTAGLGAMILGTSTAPQLVLSSNSANGLWTMRAMANGTLAIATSTHSATSTNTALSLAQSSRNALGVGSSTPWAALSITDDSTTAPIFSVATSTTGAQGSIFNIFSTTTFARHTSALSNFVQDIGARIGIGTWNFKGYGGLLDHLTIAGWWNQDGYAQAVCNSPIGAASVIADGLTGCDQYYFAEDGTGVLQAQGGGGSGMTYGQLQTNLANDGVGVWVNGTTTGWMTAATNTPRLEVNARFNQAQSATSTIFYIGFTNVNTSATAIDTVPTAGCYFTASSTQNNWRAVVNNSGTQTIQDTGVSSTTVVTGSGAFQFFRVEMDADSCSFYIKKATSTLVKTNEISSNIPITQSMNAGIYYVRSAVGNASVTFDFFGLKTFWREPQPEK